ncbi:hypothetical protein [Sporomusa sphaeroides]|uniref:hypothetical protein n=1 Tax=Sporomusa sphaeroides TaxID=47679 RepID=UPI00315810D8
MQQIPLCLKRKPVTVTVNHRNRLITLQKKPPGASGTRSWRLHMSCHYIKKQSLSNAVVAIGKTVGSGSRLSFSRKYG